jgi:hypothetical protein
LRRLGTFPRLARLQPDGAEFLFADAAPPRVLLAPRRSALPLMATVISPSLSDLVTNPAFCATALAWVLAQTLKVCVPRPPQIGLRVRRDAPRRTLTRAAPPPPPQVFTKYVSTRTWDVRVLVRPPPARASRVCSLPRTSRASRRPA